MTVDFEVMENELDDDLLISQREVKGNLKGFPK